MISKDTYSLERSNTRVLSIMHQSSSLMAKPSSKNISPSYFSSPPSHKSLSDTQVEQPSFGNSLRTRSTQDVFNIFNRHIILFIYNYLCY